MKDQDKTQPTTNTPNDKRDKLAPNYLHSLILLVAFFLALYTTHTYQPHNILLSYINSSNDGDKNPHKLPIFSRGELSTYDGSDPTLPIYLAVKGEVYDVTLGRRHYGKQGAYFGLAGRDCGRALVTGCLDPHKCPETSLDGLTEQQLTELSEWERFYKNHKEYKHIGHLSD